jgi:hypothetical protein
MTLREELIAYKERWKAVAEIEQQELLETSMARAATECDRCFNSWDTTPGQSGRKFTCDGGPRKIETPEFTEHRSLDAHCLVRSLKPGLEGGCQLLGRSG